MTQPRPDKRTKPVSFRVYGKTVRVDVPSSVKAYFNEQFVRQAPSERQRKRYLTVQKLMTLAYLRGVQDGQRVHPAAKLPQ
jgi:hypothetical protein